MTVKTVYWFGLVAFACLVVVAGLILAITARKTPHSQSAAPRKLTVAVSLAPDTALVFVAHNRNYFREENLEVTLQPHEFGRLALEAMLKGEADLATVAETPIMMAVMEGQPLAVVTQIFSSDHNSGVAARRDKGISTPRDLVGKRIGVTPGTTGDYFLYALLATQGLAATSVQRVILRPSEAADALATDRVDAASVWNPHLRQCERRLGSGGVTFHGEAIYTYTFNVAASRGLVSNDPKALELFLRALIKAEKFVRENPGPSIDIVAKSVGVDRELLAETWDEFSFMVSLQQNLLISLENEARWAMDEHLVQRQTLPNFLEFFYFDALQSVRPGAVTVMH